MTQIYCGSTTPGNTNWKDYNNGLGIYLDIDTSPANFYTTPKYFTSVGGTGGQWDLIGVTAIYNPTRTGFRVYLRKYDNDPIAPTEANNRGWYISWFGIVS